MLLYFLADIAAGKCGQTQIKHDSRRSRRAKRFQSGSSIGGNLHDKSFRLEQAFQCLLNRAIIFHHQIRSIESAPPSGQ